MKTFLSLFQDRKRVTFLCGLFLLLGSFNFHLPYFTSGNVEFKLAYQQADGHHKSDQLKAEKKELFFSAFQNPILAPSLIEFQVLSASFFLVQGLRRAYFKSCLSPPAFAIS